MLIALISLQTVNLVSSEVLCMPQFSLPVHWLGFPYRISETKLLILGTCSWVCSYICIYILYIWYTVYMHIYKNCMSIGCNTAKRKLGITRSHRWIDSFNSNNNWNHKDGEYLSLWTVLKWDLGIFSVFKKQETCVELRSLLRTLVHVTWIIFLVCFLMVAV